CSRKCCVGMVARSSARAAARLAMTMRPTPARSARISITLTVPASTRTESAIAENDSSAPVIQRTTRKRFCLATRRVRARLLRKGGGRSLRVRLVLRPRPLEGGELSAGCIDRDDVGKALQRHLQPSRIVDLRHEADIGERDRAAQGVRAGPHHGLQRGEALEDPMMIPGIDLGLLLAELVLEVA